MHRNQSRSPRDSILGSMMGPLLAAGFAFGVTATAHATFYQISDIVTDDSANLAALGLPATIAPDDANLINPWGVSFTPTTSPFWLSDNGMGLASLYRATGVQVSPPSPVPIAPPNNPPANFSPAPTGQVNNQTSGFVISNGTNMGPAAFIFATEEGTISGWTNNVNNSNQSILKVDNSRSSPAPRSAPERSIRGSP
jgi:hypothetical protein